MPKKNKTITIKPHHFLDIIKLFGSGLDRFVPNTEYGHDFWKVGNEILENPHILLKLSVDNDAICVPCKFNDGSKCSDTTSVDSEEMSKDKWNKIIDNRLLEVLNRKNGDMISALEFCILAKEKISRENIFEIWKEKPVEITERRATLLFAGIDKYIKKYSL